MASIVVPDPSLPPFPRGIAVRWISGPVPTGWEALDGEDREREKPGHAEYFDLWGTQFGQGDGETTYGWPTLSGHIVWTGVT